MHKDLTINLKDSPGTLADMCDILEEAGINIEGICAVTYKGECPIHILVNDAEVARAALEANWVEILAEKDVILIGVEDRPGFLGQQARRLAQAGINIEVAYLTTHNTLAFVVDDLAKARAAIT
jgi:hypothetical protein